jgi:hypothetical protein
MNPTQAVSQSDFFGLSIQSNNFQRKIKAENIKLTGFIKKTYGIPMRHFFINLRRVCGFIVGAGHTMKFYFKFCFNWIERKNWIDNPKSDFDFVLSIIIQSTKVDFGGLNNRAIQSSNTMILPFLYAKVLKREY